MRGRLLAAGTFVSLIVLLHGCTTAPRSVSPRAAPGAPKPPDNSKAADTSKAPDAPRAPDTAQAQSVAPAAEIPWGDFDPRYPTLSRRAAQLGAELQLKTQPVRQAAMATRLPDLRRLDPTDPEQVAHLRPVIAVAPFLEQGLALMSDFIAKGDELGRADDVSEAERTAYSKSWLGMRARVQQVQERLLDMEAVLDAVKELEDYVDSATPPLTGQSGPSAPTPQQRTRMQAIFARIRSLFTSMPEYEEYKRSREANGLQFAPAPPRVFPTLLTPNPAIELESIADHGYSASAMPDVVAPRRIANSNTLGLFCAYPPEAERKYEEGITILRVSLDATGDVSGAELVRSSGYGQLDAATLRCVAGVRFQPASMGGKPAPAVIRLKWGWRIDWARNEGTCDDSRARLGLSPPSVPAAFVCVCFEESGKAHEPQIVRSTGSAILDDRAMRTAKQYIEWPRPPGHAGCYSYIIKPDSKG